MSIPELYKEKLFFGELSEREIFMQRVKGFSQKDQKDYEKRTAEENRRFLASHPAGELFTRLSARTRKKKEHSFIPVFVARGAMGAAAAILAGVLFLTPGTLKQAPLVSQKQTLASGSAAGIASGDRIKGADPRLFVYKKSAEYGAVLLNNKAVVRPHDVLQVSYVSGGNRFGAIISVDGSGVVTQHYPDEKLSSGKLESAGETLLGFSYELDEAPYFERFIFLSANSEIQLGALNKAFTEAKDSNELLELDPAAYVPQDCRVAEVVLLKEH